MPNFFAVIAPMFCHTDDENHSIGSTFLAFINNCQGLKDAQKLTNESGIVLSENLMQVFQIFSLAS
jgi:hypothetical protein